MGAELRHDRGTDRKRRIIYGGDSWLRPPGLNADIQNAAESARQIVDTEFEILGTNAVSTCAAIATEGGVTLTTTATSGDQVIVLPHLDASQSAIATTVYPTAKKPAFDVILETAASVAALIIWAGYKLTNTSVVATDNDQAFFRFAAGSNSERWTFVISRAGVDYVYEVPQDVCGVLAASTRYALRIEVNADGEVMGFINDKPIRPAWFPTLTNPLTTLKPYVGVQTAAAAAKAITLKTRPEISRDL